MIEKNIQAERNQRAELRSAMDKRLIPLNLALSLILIALTLKQIIGY